MQIINTVLAVQNIAKAREFYQTLLEQQVEFDFGENIAFKGGLALQEMCSWQSLIEKSGEVIHPKSNAMEIYFETQDLDAFVAKLEQYGAQHGAIAYLHPIKEHAWGQRAVRFYDLDGHIIEMGEDMTLVIRRQLQSGMTPEEIEKKSMIPVEIVRNIQKEM